MTILPLRPLRTTLMLALLVAVGAALADPEVADAALARGEYREAVAAYRVAVEAAPDDAGALASLAKALSLLALELDGAEAERTFVEAERSARAAIALDPDAAEAHFELGRALGELARRRGVFASLDLADDVRAAFERTVALDPDHHDALHALAMWHLQVPWLLGGRRERALLLLERAVALAPDSVAHRVGHGEALLALGMPERARAEWERALQLPAPTAVDRADRARAEALLAEHF